ncbi:MAG: glycoside hydrolase family 25 protein [Treponema sp.]|nr:glycoside hydrolase family 25 protein [Treponema sp.]
MKAYVPIILSATFILFSCASTKTIRFRDVAGNPHKFAVNQNAAFHEFDKKKFVRGEDGKLYYDDDRYVVRHGLDISRHDGKIDWEKVRAQGYDFIIFRVAYRGYQSGILHEDENFRENIVGALAAGFDVGAYVFSQAINEEEAVEEAEFILDIIKDYNITLPVVYDPESIPWEEARTDDIPGEQFTRNTKIFCELVKEAGYRPMIYANHLWQAFMFDMEALKEYTFWYADYEDSPQLPYDFEFWQYTAKQKVDGIEPECDADIWILRRTDNDRQESDVKTAG